MAVKKDPNAIQVNGALVFVKDPSASAGELFNSWRRLSGLGSFTMPAEAGSVTDTPGIDGSISFANVAGVGNISGTIIALNAGIVHRFLEGRAKSGEAIQMSLIRPSVKVDTYTGITAATGATALAAAGSGRIAVPAGIQSRVKADVREGMIIGLWLDSKEPPATGATAAGTPDDEPDNATDFIDYDASTVVAADDKKWRTILEVADDGSWIDVAPSFSAEQASAASEYVSILIRNPGRTFRNLHGTVNQFDRGDAQTGGGISSNLQFVPSAALAVASVEQRLKGGDEATSNIRRGAAGALGGVLDGYSQALGFDI